MQYRFALCCLVAGCSSSHEAASPDTGGRTDAGTLADAGSRPDAPTPPDAATGSGGTIKLSAPRAYPADNASQFVSVGDLDGDGALDLVVSCDDDAGGGTYLDLFRGDSRGTFTFVDRVRTSDPSETAIGDFDHDGIADIAVIDWDGMGPFYEKYLHGLGGFKYSVSTWGQLTDYYLRLSSGDFDEDGAPEVVAAWTDSQHPQSPNGGFLITKPQTDTVLQSEVAFGHSTQQAVAGDFNGDGHQDVVAASSATSALKLYLGNGSGTVAFATDVALPGAAIYEIAAIDLDRDGRSDVVAIHTDGSITVSHATPFGFDAPIVLHADWSYVRGIAAGDFDHDGRLDLAFGNGKPQFGTDAPTVLVYLATDTGFANPTSIVIPAGIDFPENIASGDFNQDGFADLAVPSWHSVSVLLSTP